MDSPDGSPVLEQEASPLPLPSQRQQPPKGSGLRGLFFQSPQAETDLQAGPLLQEAPEQLEEAAAGSGSEPGWPSDDSAPDDSAPTSSEASTPAERKPFSSAALRRVCRRGVIIAGGMAHQALARTQGQRAVALYEADQEDAKNIGDPLAGIAGRRGGIGGKAANPDVEDAVSALLGVANYVTKQVVRAGIAAKIDAGEDVSHLVAVVDDEDAA